VPLPNIGATPSGPNNTASDLLLVRHEADDDVARSRDFGGAATALRSRREEHGNRLGAYVVYRQWEPCRSYPLCDRAADHP
jgi:hypothetical protein